MGLDTRIRADYVGDMMNRYDRALEYAMRKLHGKATVMEWAYLERLCRSLEKAKDEYRKSII